jgi:arabinofuranan 3-O-arabinosyltransferase
VSARRVALASHAVLALAVYPALMLTKRGQVAADSKQLLFVDPSRFLDGVPSLWDPSIGMGTVTHQKLGYLLPMGPWFWVSEQLGVPMWLSQRLWLATILFAGGAGVLYLARTLDCWGPGPLVGALAYALSPFVVAYATHLSVLLLPFAGLPWLVAFTWRAAREGGWRWPAWFAIVVALVGTVNATALVCVLVGPIVVLAVELIRERDRARVLTAGLRIAALSIAVSLWWMIALAIESRYGLDVLDFTESLETVTLASSAPEVVRGLGYWFFYGRDADGPYLEAARSYLATWALPVSFVPVLLAALAVFVVRWRHRTLFVALLVTGTVIAVGAHPYDDPSPYGSLFKTVLEQVDPARALRSITRVTPVIVLGTAVLLGVGVTAAFASSRRLGRVVAAIAVLAVVLSSLPLWRGQMISATRVRPETIPAYWRQASAALDRAGASTRVLELPGIDFAAYRWGFAHDSITPGLMDRPTVAREVVPYGTAGSVDLLAALDRRLQEGVFDPAALPAVARLMAVGDILVRSDLQVNRYGTPSPAQVWAQLSPPPAGLEAPVGFGGGRPPALAVFGVARPRQIVAAVPTQLPVIVAGSGEGLVDAAEARVPLDDRLVVYSATLAQRPEMLRRLLRDGADLVVTDSNRRRALRGKSVSDNNGYTERPGEHPLRTDYEDARLDLFPGTGDRARTVTVAHGPVARATSYGNPITLVPSERPMLALDGDPTTAWRTGDSYKVLGERLTVTLPHPVRADQVTLLQAPGGNRHITRVRISFDRGTGLDANLDAASRAAPGQVVHFRARRFRRLTVEIRATDPGPRVDNIGLSGVGFADVSVPGVTPAEELVRLPRDLLAAVGPSSSTHPLTLVMSRLRARASGPAEAAPELRLARIIDLPAARSFTLSGTVRPAAGASAPPPAPGCRSDLLTVDGAPVALQVDPAGSPASGYRVATCDGAPLVLGRGTHVLRGADGRVTGVNLDRIVLQSPPPAGSPTPGRSPRVTVLRNGATRVTARVDGARGPFWLLFGESYNDGWTATRGGTSLGAPLLAEGYANAWYVDPGRAAHVTIALRWTPQRWVWIGLLASGVALLACLVLAFRPRRPTPLRPAAAGPLLVSPLDAPARRPSTRVIAATGVTTGLVATLTVGVVGGLVVAALTAAGLRLRYGRSLLGLGALLALGGAAAYITVREGLDRILVDFPWPSGFDAVQGLTLVGILLLGVDCVTGAIRARAAQGGAAPDRAR